MESFRRAILVDMEYGLIKFICETNQYVFNPSHLPNTGAGLPGRISLSEDKVLSGKDGNNL